MFLRLRSTDPSKELAREKTDAPKVEISKKDESAADLVFSSDSESPKGNSKKRGRLRKLNDIRSVGSKGQRLLAGERKNLGRSPAEDSDQEYMETPGEFKRVILKIDDHNVHLGWSCRWCLLGGIATSYSINLAQVFSCST